MNCEKNISTTTEFTKNICSQATKKMETIGASKQTFKGFSSDRRRISHPEERKDKKKCDRRRIIHLEVEKTRKTLSEREYDIAR